MADIFWKPMMKCGHVANGGSRDQGSDEYTPSCVICAIAGDPRGYEIEDNPPDFSTRTARCAYYGRPVPNLRDRGGCKTRINERGDEAERTCWCEQPSGPNLWFFEHKADAEHDSFYCGCWGYD